MSNGSWEGGWYTKRAGPAGVSLVSATTTTQQEISTVILLPEVKYNV